MQRRGQSSNGAGELREDNGGNGVEQIGGPFEAAPWYLHDGAQTVDLYSSLGYKSQLESSGRFAKSPKRSTAKSPVADDFEYTADAPPPADDENEPPRPLVYHREISVHQDKMSVSDERFGPPPRKTLDANRYATKKTIAQGLLDVALLTANASQLKYVLQVGADNHPFYYLMLSLIIISIILQLIVGILFLVIGGMDINKKPSQRTADILNNVIVVLIFLITLVNVIINGFGIRYSDEDMFPETSTVAAAG